MVLVSKTNSLTQTHALFLEWHALQQIRNAGRFADENAAPPGHLQGMARAAQGDMHGNETR